MPKIKHHSKLASQKAERFCRKTKIIIFTASWRIFKINNSDKLLNHSRLCHGKNVLWNHRLQEQLHKSFHPYHAWAKARSSTPNKREDLLSLMHILSATIKVAWGAGIHDGKILKRYLWRNTSKRSWLLGKTNFIFLLGDYNLLLRKKDQFV